MSRPSTSSCGEARRFVTISSVVGSEGGAIKAPCPRTSAVFAPSDGVRQPPNLCNSNPVPNVVRLPKKLLYVTQRAKKSISRAFPRSPCRRAEAPGHQPLPRTARFARSGMLKFHAAALGSTPETDCSLSRVERHGMRISDRGRAGPGASRDGPRTDAERRSGPRGARASGRPPRAARRACRRGSGTRARRGGHGVGATVP